MHAPKKLMVTARALGSTGCDTGGYKKVVSVAGGRIEEQGTPAQIFGAPTSPRLTQFLSMWRDRQADAQLV
jgi:hypothetical protein